MHISIFLGEIVSVSTNAYFYIKCFSDIKHSLICNDLLLVIRWRTLYIKIIFTKDINTELHKVDNLLVVTTCIIFIVSFFASIKVQNRLSQFSTDTSSCANNISLKSLHNLFEFRFKERHSFHSTVIITVCPCNRGQLFQTSIAMFILCEKNKVIILLTHFSRISQIDFVTQCNSKLRMSFLQFFSILVDSHMSAQRFVVCNCDSCQSKLDSFINQLFRVIYTVEKTEIAIFCMSMIVEITHKLSPLPFI